MGVSEANCTKEYEDANENSISQIFPDNQGGERKKH